MASPPLHSADHDKVDIGYSNVGTRSGKLTFGFLSQIGWVGVDLFFALSGYLIGNQIFAALRSTQKFSLKNFYARRLLRTLPNFYVVVALYFLWPWFRGSSVLLPLWKFLSFTQNFELQPGTAFSHAWSLCIEEQFYLVLPAIALLIAALRRSLLWAWWGIALSFVVGMGVRAYLWTHFVDGNAEGGIWLSDAGLEFFAVNRRQC